MRPNTHKSLFRTQNKDSKLSVCGLSMKIRDDTGFRSRLKSSPVNIISTLRLCLKYTPCICLDKLWAYPPNKLLNTFRRWLLLAATALDDRVDGGCKRNENYPPGYHLFTKLMSVYLEIKIQDSGPILRSRLSRTRSATVRMRMCLLTNGAWTILRTSTSEIRITSEIELISNFPHLVQVYVSDPSGTVPCRWLVKSSVEM